MNGKPSFADRLTPDRYGDDPLIGWTTNDGATEAWVPDRLVARLLHLGRAYELHLLPLLPGVDPLVLNETQARHLIDEIAWLLARVDDPALREVSNHVGPVLRAAARGSGLTIE